MAVERYTGLTCWYVRCVGRTRASARRRQSRGSSLRLGQGQTSAETSAEAIAETNAGAHAETNAGTNTETNAGTNAGWPSRTYGGVGAPKTCS